MLGIVRRGFLVLSAEHWEQVVTLICPLMQKFRYKTDLLFDAFINITLLGYTLSPEIVEIQNVPHQYEHLV